MKPKALPDLRAIREKSLQELEGEIWGPPTYDSHVVQTVHRLRTVPLKQFGIEELRITIGQGVGLPYLVPIALEHLQHHPFAAGDYYRGDLLKAVTRVPADFWAARPELAAQYRRTLEAALIRVHMVDTVPELAAELRDALDALR
jgi:hypothetical protein